MVAFAGTELPAKMAKLLAARPVAGVTLFRQHNVGSPGQVRALTAQLQAAAPDAHRPMLVAADQEGGQLIALGDETTQFAGAMALGAAGDVDLAERVSWATGRELRAMGVNVNYAPVCDLATNPASPSLGIRSFGDDPAAVGQLTAATVRGHLASGVAATVKHFPGAGDASVDTHHQLAVVACDSAAMEQRELVPFRAALAAGAQLVMAGHFALPALTGDPTLPTSLARRVITDLLRNDMGFTGLTITDALDMHALAQGAGQVVDAIVAIRAGQDLLLGTADDQHLARLEEGVAQAERRGLIDPEAGKAASARLATLRSWLGRFDQPPLEVVGCAEHQALAAELARRSITLVRNADGLLPLVLARDARVAVIHSMPADLTPADTSSGVTPTLGAALRRRLPGTDELLAPAAPTATDIAALRQRAADYDVVVVGTFAAHLQLAQADLALAILDAGRPTVTVALRTPWDLTAYPMARTHVATYGILPPTMEALAAALLGEDDFAGRLPVEIAGLHPRGHGLRAVASPV
jgi:beta-N-acetylhexosaminidase